MAKIIKRVEFTLEDGRALTRLPTLELLGLLTFGLLNEMFSTPQIDAEYDESEVKPDEPS